MAQTLSELVTKHESTPDDEPKVGLSFSLLSFKEMLLFLSKIIHSK